jgi:hypothetical protein
MNLLVKIYALKNGIFICLFEIIKATETKFCEIREIPRKYTEFRGIFANSVPHTECSEVKKGTEFGVDGIP